MAYLRDLDLPPAEFFPPPEPRAGVAYTMIDNPHQLTYLGAGQLDLLDANFFPVPVVDPRLSVDYTTLKPPQPPASSAGGRAAGLGGGDDDDDDDDDDGDGPSREASHQQLQAAVAGFEHTPEPPHHTDTDAAAADPLVWS